MNDYRLWYDWDSPILDVGDFSQMLPEEDERAEEVISDIQQEATDMLNWVILAQIIRARPRDELGHYVGPA